MIPSDLIPKQYHEILKIKLAAWRIIHENQNLYKEYYKDSLDHVENSKWYTLHEKNMTRFNNRFTQDMVLMREIYLLGIKEGQRRR